MKYLSFLILILIGLSGFAAKPKHTFVRLKTNKGECIIMLYNQTPKHRDNFLKLVKEHYYDSTLFHRVIKDFMIQGGDPDSKTAKPSQTLGEGDLGYTVEAEFRDSLFHKKGALAAARDNNPKKASSACQFYLVQGKKWGDAELNQLEAGRLQGRKINPAHREVYKSVGGTPHLDQTYTVFGEVIKGIELIDTIANAPTAAANRPIEDVKMEITLLKKRQAKKLEKELKLSSQL